MRIKREVVRQILFGLLTLSVAPVSCDDSSIKQPISGHTSIKLISGACKILRTNWGTMEGIRENALFHFSVGPHLVTEGTVIRWAGAFCLYSDMTPLCRPTEPWYPSLNVL